ncbi:uncharacterized protein LOC114466098 [Gouania willdenowi]|uniref:uncharacterized protein LOC114466098 n=1 Tax=Gouania willdenowi TaxID=441366 RepID=UPI00105693AE|nr:uncharacterized protein LOC114466098 [Gouania willdenowi]
MASVQPSDRDTCRSFSRTRRKKRHQYNCYRPDMEFEVQQLLWLLATFTLTTQELVKLKMKPIVIAECGKQVSLHCNTSSQQELSIKYMEWSQGNALLCSLDNKGTVTKNLSNSGRDFSCKYTNGSLSLILAKVVPLEVRHWKPYRCKQYSTQGILQGYTKVQLQECNGTIETVLKTDGPACTFNHVYPDGDVHWFSNSRNLSDWSPHNTTKRVDEQGWLTIHSYLEEKHLQGTYNCSLMSTVSGRLIASALVHQAPLTKTVKLFEKTPNNSHRIRLLGRTWMVSLILLFFIVKS